MISGFVDFLKTAKEPFDTVLEPSANEANGVPFGHWKNVLECILESPHVTESGIRRIIEDALASVQGKVLSAIVFHTRFP